MCAHTPTSPNASRFTPHPLSWSSTRSASRDDSNSREGAKRSQTYCNPGSGDREMTTSSVPAAGVTLQKVMARYAVPRVGPAVSNLLTSVTPYVGLIGAACVALRFSPWLAGGLSVVAAGFLIRTFIVFH